MCPTLVWLNLPLVFNMFLHRGRRCSWWTQSGHEGSWVYGGVGFGTETKIVVDYLLLFWIWTKCLPIHTNRPRPVSPWRWNGSRWVPTTVSCHYFLKGYSLRSTSYRSLVKKYLSIHRTPLLYVPRGPLTNRPLIFWLFHVLTNPNPLSLNLLSIRLLVSLPSCFKLL